MKALKGLLILVAAVATTQAYSKDLRTAYCGMVYSTDYYQQSYIGDRYQFDLDEVKANIEANGSDNIKLEEYNFMGKTVLSLDLTKNDQGQLEYKGSIELSRTGYKTSIEGRFSDNTITEPLLIEGYNAYDNDRTLVNKAEVICRIYKDK